MRPVLQIIGVLVGLFLAIGFVLTEARPYVPQGLLPMLALALTAVAVWVAVILVRRILRRRRISGEP